MEDISVCQIKTIIDEKFEYSVAFNLPQKWRSIDFIINQLLSIKETYITVALLPTAQVTFKESCHLCLRRYQPIFKHELCLFFIHRDRKDIIKLTEKINLLDKAIEVEALCQAKSNKELFCPLIIEQHAIEKDRECSLIRLVESWFSDDEIFKHKDILVAMNNGGWVPIALISSKLQDIIYLTDDALAARLNQSDLFVIDTTQKFLRRVNLKLPITDEYRQILLLDIPDSIKCIKQLSLLLNIDGSKVESFDYGSHSALLSVSSRYEAENIVEQSLESLSIQCKLLVPNINDSDKEFISKDANCHCNDIHKLLHNFVMKESVPDEVHVTRFDPTELTYNFRIDFSPPSHEQISKIVTQCNFYFSDANVLKDLFILKKIKSNSGGWIDIDIISKFKMMIKLSNDNVDNIIYAMCFSDQVQISRDGKNLRRRLPLPDWDSSIYTRSLFLWRLPQYCQSFETFDNVFREEGRFAVNISRFIRANRNVPADLRKLVDKIPALGKENCGVIEFGNRSAMLSADDYIHMKWPSVKSFYLGKLLFFKMYLLLFADIKSELPKPAVIVGRTTKCLPPPIPILDSHMSVVSSLQAGTRVDPRFWNAAKIFNAKKREEQNTDVPKFTNKEFPPLTKEKFMDNTNIRNDNVDNKEFKKPSVSKIWNNINAMKKKDESNENKKPSY